MQRIEPISHFWPGIKRLSVPWGGGGAPVQLTQFMDSAVVPPGRHEGNLLGFAAVVDILTAMKTTDVSF